METIDAGEYIRELIRRIEERVNQLEIEIDTTDEWDLITIASLRVRSRELNWIKNEARSLRSSMQMEKW